VPRPSYCRDSLLPALQKEEKGLSVIEGRENWDNPGGAYCHRKEGLSTPPRRGGRCPFKKAASLGERKRMRQATKKKKATSIPLP